MGRSNGCTTGKDHLKARIGRVFIDVWTRHCEEVTGAFSAKDDERGGGGSCSETTSNRNWSGEGAAMCGIKIGVTSFIELSTGSTPVESDTAISIAAVPLGQMACPTPLAPAPGAPPHWWWVDPPILLWVVAAS